MPKNQALPEGARVANPPAHQAAYQDLRDRILFGELAPGQSVTIQGLCDQLASGMTPVREAIRRLIAEGALNMLGNRRIVLPELSLACVDEIEFMRKVLESRLVFRATSRMTAAQLNNLKGLDEALNTAIEGGDIRSYLTCNYRFHTSLYAIAEAPITAETVDRLWLRFGPSLRVVCGRYGTQNLPDKHAELLQALAQGDATAAAGAVEDDVHQGMSQIRATLRRPDK